MNKSGPTGQPSVSQKARILVVDEHPLFRLGLASLLNRQSDLMCCGDADTVAGTFAAVHLFHPDLVVLDLCLSREDGLELVKTLLVRFAALPILVLTQCDESAYVRRVLSLGAKGYLLKEAGADEILDAVRAVLNGRSYFSRRLAVRLAGKLTTRALQTRAAPGIEKLTDRERQVFQLLGAGFVAREVAERLGVSTKTIETHRENIKQRLGFNNGQELFRAAARWLAGNQPH